MNQSTLTKYFQCKASPLQLNSNMSNKPHKRPSLSLKKASAPKKISKTSLEVSIVKQEIDIITLISESEEETEETPSKKQLIAESINNKEASTSHGASGHLLSQSSSSRIDMSNSATTNFVYNLSPGAVLDSVDQLPNTPVKTPKPKKSFYSPTKKRMIKKTPVKRILASQFNENVVPENLDDKISTQNYVPQDDKTVFFLSIIDKCLITDNLKNLLEESSQKLLQNCMQVADPGMMVMRRLYWCQSGWYRIEELGKKIPQQKKEVLSSPDLYTMINSLVEYGLITPPSEGELGFDDYVTLLKRDELLNICKELKLKIQSKQDAVKALRSYSKHVPISNFLLSSGARQENNSTRVLAILKSKTPPCYKMSELARTTFYNLHVLMYLGMDYSIIREKKLELTLLYDKSKKETYPIDKDMMVDDASVVFQDQGEFYRYLQAHKVYEAYMEMTDTNGKCETVTKTFNLYKEITDDHMLRYKSLPLWLRRFTPPHIYVKILEDGVNELKKLKLYNFAIEVLDILIDQIAFRQHHKANWYAEKALILHNQLESSEKAAKVLIKAFKSDMSEELKDAMRLRANKIANQKNIDLKEELRNELRQYADNEAIRENNKLGDHIQKMPMDNYMQKGKLKFEVHTREGRAIYTAEEYCIYHYVSNNEYTHGEHWEGRIVTTIFFLLFWDIIYSKPRGVTGIFLSHFQRYPLDMFGESFYINRRTLIDERLQFIQQSTEEELIETMKAKWDERPESERSDIQRSMSWDTLREVTSCLRSHGVAAICRRLATNYAYARSGFPDLTLWNIHTKKIKFVEVKTDADKPSVKQLQWLHYLSQCGLAAGFCYVGADTTRSRARPSFSSSASQ